MSNRVFIVENTQQFRDAFKQFTELSNNGTGIHMIGLDCEYVTKNLHLESYENAVWCPRKDQHKIAAKLQIATENMCIIVDLCKIGHELPADLISVLESENWLKFGVGITVDMEILAFQYNLKKYDGVFDMGIICKYLGCSTPNLEHLYNSFNCSPDKFKKTNDRYVDWSKDMTTSQIKYASGDAFASYNIGKEMMKYTKTSFDIMFEKYKSTAQEQCPSANCTSIELPTVNNNFVGLINEYSQKNKMPLPIFDYVRQGDLFVCKCDMEMPNGKITTTSSPNTNKKNAKHEVCKKIYEVYLSKGI